MSNFRKFISLSAIAVLGVTNLLTPLSYASAAPEYDALTSGDLATHNLNFVMPDKDVYLYAHTEANHYFVDYYGNQSTSGSMSRSEFVYDATGQNLTKNVYERTGYTFTGWNTQENGGGTGYIDQAEVDNWTTGTGVIDIYAQWRANIYNIIYNLNDDDGGTSSGVHSKTPKTGAYDQDLTILNPSRTGYKFSGWTITGMDSELHKVGGKDSHATTENGVTGTVFRNLNATNGADVNFKAIWSPEDTPYLVEYFLQKIGGEYPTTPNETGGYVAPTDSTVTGHLNTYTGFTTPAAQSTGVRADGSTVITYEYPRKQPALTLTAGRGIASASATGTSTSQLTVNSGSTDSKEFWYDETVTLSFVLKDGYENGTWSGYKDTASGFNMPEFATGKTAYATPIVYNLTVNCVGGNNCTPSGTYTVESGSISLNTPDRVHSEFAGWTGTNIVGTAATVSIPSGSTGNRVYTATWSCHDGYHLSDVNGGSCQPDENTDYDVRHYLQDFTGDYTILYRTVTQTGTTDTVTDAHELDIEGFEVAHIATGNINGNTGAGHRTVVDITYNRLNYTGSVDVTTGVSVTHEGANDGKNGATSGHHQYDDVVTITATTGAGYTFTGWTITDANGNDITDQLLSGDEITSTTATFNMPASPVVIKANVKTNEYKITYELHDGHLTGGKTNQTGYTVEDDFTLNEPERDHSVFLGWSGTDITTAPERPITINDMIGDRSYEAIWGCVTGYHASGANECAPNEYQGKVDYADNEHGAPEEVSFVYDDQTTIENPSQSGYIFSGWRVTGMSGGVEHVLGIITTTGDSVTVDSGATTFMNLSTEQGMTDIRFTAIWTPRDDTQYVIYHYTRDLNTNTYTLRETYTGKGVTDTSITFTDVTGTYEGFTYSGGYVNVTNPTTRPEGAGVTTGNIDKDGSTKIYLYYDRNIRNVFLSGDAHVATLTGAGAYEYGDNVTVDMTAETGYHFTTWEKRGTGWVALP